MASLNEFRQFFGLEPHKTFRDVNEDLHIQEALENLYDSPDMIEMYPGIFIEGIEKADCADEKHTKLKGVGFPRTAARGVLSDAVTLVRSDRFYTIVCTGMQSFPDMPLTFIGLYNGNTYKLGTL